MGCKDLIGDGCDCLIFVKLFKEVLICCCKDVNKWFCGEYVYMIKDKEEVVKDKIGDEKKCKGLCK